MGPAAVKHLSDADSKTVVRVKVTCADISPGTELSNGLSVYLSVDNYCCVLGIKSTTSIQFNSQSSIIAFIVSLSI